jgi:hypothetical protein
MKMINKMRNIIIVVISLIITSCLGETESSEANSEGETSEVVANEKLNISILLDLSDRLERNLQPSQKDRDIEIIAKITELFKADMKATGAFNALGKIKVIFKPSPKDPEINNIAKDLKYDLSKLKNAGKKEVYDNITENFKNSLTRIYDLSLNSRNWVGCDIWRFFKNDAADLCVDSDSTYRNVLVILSDGYIFHEQSEQVLGNQSTYITGPYFSRNGLRNNPNWENKMNEEGFKLMPVDQSLGNLEILFLEVNSFDDHKNDEDIIRKYLANWFAEMKVNDFDIYNTALPENTSVRIDNFFK